MSDYGPVYGVELITDLPLDGGMRQAMPSRRDLQQVREISERTAAGYEVLLEHYRRAVEACRSLIDAIDNSPGDDLGQAARAKAFMDIRAVLAKGASQ